MFYIKFKQYKPINVVVEDFDYLPDPEFLFWTIFYSTINQGLFINRKFSFRKN